MNRYLLLFLFFFFISCTPDGRIEVREYSESNRIIYGRINQQVNFEEESINGFLINNEIVRINCKECLFKIERIKLNSRRNVLKLQQYYKGFKVFGHTLGIHTDPENRPIYIIDHSFPFYEEFKIPEHIITLEEARNRLIKHLRADEGDIKIKDIELGIATYTEKPLLKYRMKAFISKRPFESGTFYVDAVSGEVFRYEPALIPFKVRIVNTNNDSVDVEISKKDEEYSGEDCTDNYCAVDTTRGQTPYFETQFIKTFYEIEMAQMPGELPPSSMLFSSPEPDRWEGTMPDGAMTRRIEGISAHYSAQRIFDWYSQLGLRGNVNKDNGFRVFLERMAYGPLELNAFWDIYSHSAMVIWVYQVDEATSRSFASSYDVIGHEFTHGVLSAPLSEGGLAELEYNNSAYPKNESASVQEGLADTMGLLSQGDENPNWLMGYNGLIDENGNHRWIRNDSNPYDPEALTWGDKEYIGQCSQRICAKYPPPDGHKGDCQMPLDMYDATYICATTIAYPAWKIKNSIGVEKTTKIYFNVIDKYLQKKELIPSVSQYVFDSCMELYNNNEGECCLVYQALKESRFDINLRGIVCNTIEDAGLDSSSDLYPEEPRDIISEDSIDTEDVLSDQSELRDETIETSDIYETDIRDIYYEDILSDEDTPDTIFDTNPDIIQIEENLTNVENDSMEIVDTEAKGDSSSASEKSGGCSCNLIE